MAALALSILAVLLSGPVPALLARATAIRRAPRAAMVLWQAVALAAVLSALGATLAVLTLGLTRWPPTDGLRWYDVAAAVVGLATTAVVLGRLLLTGHLVGTRLRGVRRRHRELLDVMAEEDDGVLVVDGGTPVAWCVPGLAGGRVVISRGAVEQLTAEERAAVVAHERAHLDARHDLVLEAFTVLHRAFPRWVSSASALREVRLLTEVLADQAARRRHGPAALGRALVALTERDPTAAAARPPARSQVVLAAGGSQLLTRVELLHDGGSHRVLAACLVALAAAVLVLPTVLVVLPWLAALAAGA